MAISHGLTSAIMDARTPQLVDAVKAADLLLGNDAWGANWISMFRARQGA
jgi:5-methyltetrahydrofolate--homocysteine methyltransferase